jgi:hypothetical protein
MTSILCGIKQIDTKLTINEQADQMNPKYDYKFWDEMTPKEKMSSANYGRGVTVFNQKTQKYSTKFPVLKSESIQEAIDVNDDDWYEINPNTNTVVMQRGPQSFRMPFGQREIKLPNGNIVMRGMSLKTSGLDKTLKLKQEPLSEEEQLDEDLRKWFKEKWVRFGPDGKIRGDCARGDDSEGKPKCLPQSKAQNLGKKGRASAASRKRREDPNPERSGKAINVDTKKKSNEGVAEGWFNKTRQQGAEPNRPLSAGAGYAGMSDLARLEKDASDALKMAKSLQLTNSSGRYDEEIKRFQEKALRYKQQADAIKKQGLAEAGNKPVEKSYFGMGDTRTPRDIKSQMRGASDNFVKSTADTATGPIHSRVAKMQAKMAKSELRKRSDHDRMATGTNEGVAEGFDKEAEAYKAHLLKTAPKVMDFLSKTVKGWRPSEEEMLGAIDTGYIVMKHTGDVKQAGKAMMDELNTLHRMSQGQQGVTEEQLDELKCWPGYHRVAGTKAGFPGSCAKNKTNEENIAEDSVPFDQCPHCRGPIVHESMLNEKQDACYHKVKSRYKVWPSAYASGALVQCRKKGASNWGNKSEGVAEGSTTAASGKLNEVFNTQPSNSATWARPIGQWDEMDEFNFVASNGVAYQVDFLAPVAGPAELDPYTFFEPEEEISDQAYESAKFVSFEQKSDEENTGGKQGIEGTGVAAEVFGIVTNVILQYIKKAKPSMLYFQAAEPNRQRLYARMAERLAQPIRWKVKQDGPAHFAIYNPRVIDTQGVAEDQLDEKWSQKYKSSINCSDPKGFSQKAHCAGKKKNESAILTGLQLHESK